MLLIAKTTDKSRATLLFLTICTDSSTLLSTTPAEQVGNRGARGLPLLTPWQILSITGTYAGQYIMHGFMDIKMKEWAEPNDPQHRQFAIVPSLVVFIVGDSSGISCVSIIALVDILFPPWRRTYKIRHHDIYR